VSCQNGGNCLKKRTLAFECNCTQDYAGLQCEQSKSQSCLSLGCRNGGCRLNLTGQYACQCDTPGYEGTYCEVEKCNPGCVYGKCNRDSSGNYYCSCYANYNGANCGTLVCFSGNTLVEHQTRGSMRIGDLKQGDYIKTYDEATQKWIFSKFVTYLHINRNILGQYIQIRTSGNKTLTISSYHYIARRPSNEKSAVDFVFAKDIKLNDNLITENDIAEFVTHISEVYEEGAYAPLTEAGTLAVNSIYASCYANVVANSWAHYLFQPIIQASKYFTDLKFYDETSEDSAGAEESGMFWYARFFFKILPYLPFSSSIAYF
jgi:hypothetical protein